MALKGKKPELIVPSKPKFLISGESGIGKTFFALDFPKPYLIDTEGGAVREQYQHKIEKNGGLYLGKEEGSQDFNIVLDEIKQLAETNHGYKTLIIDSFSHLYLLEAARAEENLGSDYGRDKKEANKPTRQLIRWLEKLDMTVILICHSKIKWVRKGKEITSEGTTFDGYDKLEYILDLWIEIVRGIPNPIYEVRKTRIESFPLRERLPLQYSDFSSRYGKEVIEKEPVPIKLANENEINQIEELIKIMRVENSDIEKWFNKAGVESFEEMTSEQIQICIKFLEKKLSNITQDKPKTKKKEK